MDNKEWEDDDGLPATGTRLDETLCERGDTLRCLYDYGDNWELTLRLEEVLPAETDCPAAVVVDGERAAPPEDCGHLVDADSLAEVPLLTRCGSKSAGAASQRPVVPAEWLCCCPARPSPYRPAT